MTSKEMIKFIIDEGTLEAKKALADISGPVSRGQLCVIFHMFRKGRAEIAKGDVPAGFRLTPSPNRAAAPKAASPKRMVGSMSVPIRARGRTAAYSVSRPRSASSSPNYSPNKMAKILAFTKGSERRRLLKAGLKGLRSKRKGILRMVHGVKVYMQNPPPRYVNAIPVDVEYHQNNGAKSNSNKSQVSNYGGSNNGGSNGNRITFVNYQNLRAKRNKVVKAAPSSRFAKKMKIRKVGSRKFKKSARPMVMKKARTQPYMQFTPIKNNKTARIPTRSQVYGGSRSSLSRAQIKAASDARWKKYDAMIRQMQEERKRRSGSGSSSSNSNLSPNKKAALANRLFQEALANVNKGKIALPVMKRRSPINLASLGLGSSSNSNASAGSRRSGSPKASLPRATARRVQERLERKLRSMARRKVPKVNIANEWERSMLKGPQGEKVSLRKTSAERALAKELASKLIKFNSPNSNRSSSNGSPAKAAPKAVKKTASGMKSLRKK
jgi:hypothetical protein